MLLGDEGVITDHHGNSADFCLLRKWTRGRKAEKNNKQKLLESIESSWIQASGVHFIPEGRALTSSQATETAALNSGIRLAENYQ